MYSSSTAWNPPEWPAYDYVAIVEGPTVAMKLEQVGATVISTDGNYSEDTTIRVTAVDANSGVTLAGFVGTVNVAEDGTAIYSQNVPAGAVLLPASVNITTGGTVTFVARSLAGPAVEGVGGLPPLDAKIKTTNYPVYKADNLAIPQWITSGGPGPTYNNTIDPLASGAVYDWVQARTRDIQARFAVLPPQAPNDVDTVLRAVSLYSTGATRASAGFVPQQHAAQSPITLNPYFIAMRLDSATGAVCGQAPPKSFTGIFLHEARHTYQNAQANIAGNDVDQDFLVNSVSIAPNDILLDTVAIRNVCDLSGGAPGVIVGLAYHGDKVPDTLDLPDNARFAVEMDAYAFEGIWNR